MRSYVSLCKEKLDGEPGVGLKMFIRNIKPRRIFDYSNAAEFYFLEQGRTAVFELENAAILSYFTVFWFIKFGYSEYSSLPSLILARPLLYMQSADTTIPSIALRSPRISKPKSKSDLALFKHLIVKFFTNPIFFFIISENKFNISNGISSQFYGIYVGVYV